MNQCYLPNTSSLTELLNADTSERHKVAHFHHHVKDQIHQLLGETYVLPQLLDALTHFSDTLSPFIDPEISFSDGQLREKDMSNKYDIYDHYFDVTRVENMSYGQMIEQYLDTSAELIGEMRYTSMSRGEIAYILKAWEASNQILLINYDQKIPDFQLGPPKSNAPQDGEERALYRWKLAHHGFAIFMIFSGYCFDQALEGLESDQNDAIVADWINKGAHLFRATTSCMEFGNSFTAKVYQNVVRPDMSRANEEANLPNGFSGTQNLEYVQWRKRKNKLLRYVKNNKEKISTLVMDNMELFRCYYLEDMAIHAIIAGRMVGIEKSLLQDGIAKAKGNFSITAADMLRMMGQKRFEEVQFIME